MRAFLRRWLGIDQEIRIARLRPDDVVVVEMNGRLSEDVLRNVQYRVQDIFPQHRVIVVDDATSLHVLRPDALDEQAVEV